MAKKTISNWWRNIFVILILLTVLIFIAYSIGANGIRFGGASVRVNRSDDYQLYKINDEASFYYNPENKIFFLAKYQPAFVLFRIFGEYEVGDEIINEPLAMHGDWLYSLNSGYYDKGRIIGYNIKTKEKIIKRLASKSDKNVAEFTEKGFDTNNSEKITPEVLLNYQQISVPKESAIITSGGFFIAILLWLLVLPFAIRKSTN